MTATVDPAPKQMARFVVMYDTPSDVDAFERHDVSRLVTLLRDAATVGLDGSAIASACSSAWVQP